MEEGYESWEETKEAIIFEIDEYLKDNGFEIGDDGRWTRFLSLSDMNDPWLYITTQALETILEGGAIDDFGVGATGVANYLAEAYVRFDLEDNLEAILPYSSEELDVIADESEWAEISKYIHDWVRIRIDIDEVKDWLDEQGF